MPLGLFKPLIISTRTSYRDLDHGAQPASRPISSLSIPTLHCSAYTRLSLNSLRPSGFTARARFHSLKSGDGVALPSTPRPCRFNLMHCLRSYNWSRYLRGSVRN